jgi:hypothetical protein
MLQTKAGKHAHMPACTHTKNNSSISRNADEEKSNLIASKDKVIDSQKHTQPIQD